MTDRSLSQSESCKIADGRFATINDAWTAAQGMGESILVETSILQDRMNMCTMVGIIAVIILGIFVWQADKGKFRDRLAITLLSALLLTCLLFILMQQIRASLLRIDRESQGIVYGFAHAMQLANVINTADIRSATQRLMQSKGEMAAAAAARSQGMM